MTLGLFWFVCGNISSNVRLIKRGGSVAEDGFLFLPSLLSRNRIAPERADTNKENIPSGEAGIWGDEAGGDSGSISNSSGGPEEPAPPPRKHSPTLVPLRNNQDAHAVSPSLPRRRSTFDGPQVGRFSSGTLELSSLRSL